MLLLLAPAFALDLDSYRLAGAPWEAEGSLGLTGAEVGTPGSWSLGLAGIVANEVAPGEVESLDTLRLAFGAVILPNLRLELEVPAHPGVLAESGWASGVGDPELRARVALAEPEIGERAVHIAIEPVIAFPNGDEALGVGAGGLSGGITLPAGMRISPKLRVDAQVAVMAAPPGAVGELEMGSWFGYGGGVTWDGPAKLHISGELTGRIDLQGVVEAEDAPLDLGAGVSWAGEAGFGVALGGSVGLLEGPGAPAQRLVLAVGWLEKPAGHAAHHHAEVAATCGREGELAAHDLDAPEPHESEPVAEDE